MSPYVFLAGDYVYKIKKPVRFDFLDASTLARRRQLCLDEVRLNRRLAPDVYLGVVAILRREGGELVLGEAGGGAGEAGAVVEWAVRMRRLADATMLDRMVARHAASVAQIRAIAARLAGFHGAAATDRDGSTARRRRCGGWCAETSKSSRTIAPRSIAPAGLAELERFLHRAIESRWSLLNRRARGARVCEGHGDLRCEHVSLAGDTIAIIDCVEFSEGLRYVDVASDVGFLAMDLDRLGARGLADELVGAYREASGDADLPLLVPLYKIHRALVRAKVESLTSRDLAIAPAQRATAAAAARSYVELALDFARESRPALWSWSAGFRAAANRPWRDAWRTGSASNGCAPTKFANAWPGSRPPSVSPTATARAPTAAEFTRKTYAALLDAAAARLRDGDGVIVDATFAAPDYRAEALALAARAGGPPLFVECAASHDEIVRRVTLARETPRKSPTPAWRPICASATNSSHSKTSRNPAAWWPTPSAASKPCRPQSSSDSGVSVAPMVEDRGRGRRNVRTRITGPTCRKLPHARTPACVRKLPGWRASTAKRRRCGWPSSAPTCWSKLARGARLVQWLWMLADPMALMLAGAALLYLLLGKPHEAVVLAAVIIPVLGVDVLMEVRSRDALKKLAGTVAPRARVCATGGRSNFRPPAWWRAIC